jgi:hypothetical protein
MECICRGTHASYSDMFSFLFLVPGFGIGGQLPGFARWTFRRFCTALRVNDGFFPKAAFIAIYAIVALCD